MLSIFRFSGAGKMRQYFHRRFSASRRDSAILQGVNASRERLERFRLE